MLSRLIVWRHGRTVWNAGRRIQGQRDIDLDPAGVAQAGAAARVLAEAAPTVIVSSDLRRARGTAAALAARVSLPVEIEPRLRERAYGDWEGLTAGEIADRYPAEHDAWQSEGHIDVPGVEQLPELAARVAAALRDWVERAAGGTVVAVTHGSAGRHGCRALLGLPPELAHVIGVLANCRWTELRPAPRGWQLVEHNVGAPPPPMQEAPAAAE